MLKEVDLYIRRHRLLTPGRLYLVALSGGADSVALLLALKQLGHRLEAVHCNFHLRGSESDRDEQFVADLCRQQHIPLHRIHFDTKEYALLHKVSIEMAARDLRYTYFARLKDDIGAEAVCVAHHRDDAAETLLMNLTRGTGIHGLTGIRPKQGFVVRPLLGVSRQQIEAFLADIGQDYVTDSTNLTDDVVRNKIRLNVLPLLSTINPSATEAIADTANRLSEVEKVYNEAMERQLAAISNNTLHIETLQSFCSPRSLLFEWLRKFDFSPATIDQIAAHLDAESGRLWSSPTHELLIDRGRIIVEPRRESRRQQLIPEQGCYVIDEQNKLRLTLTDEVAIDKSRKTACLDAEKVAFPLTLRPTRQGDRFVPFGMKGSRLVSDFLTDRKLSLFERRRTLVLTDANDTIVWLVGQRPDQRFCLSESTKKMLLCQWLGE